MKTFAILFTLLYFLNALAVAPYGFKGQNQSTTLYSNVLQAPNNLVTNLGGINGLMETGNNNILSNPSFEHLTFDSSWTNAGIAVDSAETTNVIHGKKAVRIDASSETVIFRQDSSLYAAQFADGVQGLASVRIKSNVALKVCSRQANTTSTTNCVDVQANNKWGLYKVPMILGATSNGISIASTGLVTGTIYIDDAFVGANSLTQEMNACNNVNCETEFSASVSNTGVISGENLDWLNTCVFGTGYLCTFNTSIFTVAPNCVVTAADTTGGLGLLNSTSSTSVNPIFISRTDGGSTNVQTPFRIVCQKQGADFAAAKQLSNGNTYSSTNADTDWTDVSNVSAGTFITAVTTNPTYGTVQRNKAQWKRQGSDLLLRWDFRQSTAGTAGSGVYLINIPTETGCTIDLTKAPANISVTGTLAANKNSNIGTFYYGDSANDGMGQVFPYSSTQIAAAFIYAGTTQARGWWSSATGGMNVTPQSINVDARIPCANWQNSNIIIGQFNGLESCTDSYECTDTYSAKISSAGVVSDENLDWITGNASLATSTYTITFKTGLFTVAPNCAYVTTENNNLIHVVGVSTSSSNVVVRSARPDTGAPLVGSFQIICQKQGVDYNGKTAKAVRQEGMVYTEDFTNGGKQSLTTNGYQKLPGGLIMQWGTFVNPIDTPQVVSFPIAFPTAALNVTTTHAEGSIVGLSTTTFSFDRVDGVSGSPTVYYFAIGY
jgi:hypothetical protein